jgi:hypothetical protein
MNGKLKLLAVTLFPLVFLSSQQVTNIPPNVFAPYQIHRQHAIQINELAGNLRSPEDARRLVDMIAALFADELPPKWATRKLRNRLAMAEYQSSTDPEMRIPEERIVDAWNRYVAEIGAPQESLVNVTEIHYLRDSSYVTSRISWNYGNQTIWTMTNIYAVGPDGKIGRDCRTLEALRIVWELANEPENLTGAREMVRKGILPSDLFEQSRESSASVKGSGSVSVRSFGAAMGGGFLANPVLVAEIQYQHERGEAAMAHAITQLVTDLLPPQTKE